jgi:hypothetical protein
MKRILPILIAMSLLAVAPATATHRAGHQGGNTGQLTAAANPLTVTFGAATVISGKLSGRNVGGQRVTLAEDPYPYGDGFRDVVTTTTDANGNYSFRRTPESNRNYRVSVGNQRAFTGVRVRTRLTLGVSDSTPSDGEIVRFAGLVYPKHDGRIVLLQRRRADGTWATVARTTTRSAATGDRSRFSRRYRIGRTGTFRVRMGSDGDHVTGTSRTRRLTVSG